MGALIMFASKYSPGVFPTESDLDDLAECLRRQGYAVLDNKLPEELVDALFLATRGKDEDEFTRAGTGREQDFRTNRFVRTDEIVWLEPRPECQSSTPLC